MINEFAVQEHKWKFIKNKIIGLGELFDVGRVCIKADYEAERLPELSLY